MTSFLETAELYPLSDIRRDRAMLPDTRGLYGLFFRSPPGQTPVSGCYIRDGLSLLYIGTAGADLGKNGTVKKRLGSQHLGGNERRSTICHSLAALLPNIAGPAIAKLESRGIKYHTSADGVAQLSRWMDAHISACWISFPRPADLEAKLVRNYGTPLNIEHGIHEFSATLESLREDRRKAAVRELRG